MTETSYWSLDDDDDDDDDGEFREWKDFKRMIQMDIFQEYIKCALRHKNYLSV